MVRGGLVALIVGTAMTSGALADCRVVNTTFRVHLNEQVTSTGVSTKGGACTTRLGAGGHHPFHLDLDRRAAGPWYTDPGRRIALPLQAVVRLQGRRSLFLQGVRHEQCRDGLRDVDLQRHRRIATIAPPQIPPDAERRFIAPRRYR